MKLTEHKVFSDSRGKLVAIENYKDIPFSIKRVFFIFGTQPKLSRGNHAHLKTKQYLVAMNGSCKVTLDDGKSKKTYSLSSPHIGLLQEEMIWGEMHDFSDDCVLLVMADKNYDNKDYIHDYKFFLTMLNE
tara:strand:- start:69 stop:461 length:393 start_codon:yes stop_codon:yes gene_type:complete